MANRVEVYHLGNGPPTATRARRILSLCERGKVAEARLLLRDDSDPEMLLARGVVFHHLARAGAGVTHEEAKNALTRAEDAGADTHLCAVYLGLCYWRQGDASSAGVMFTRALESQDTHTRFLAYLGRLQIECEEKRGQDALNTCAEMEPSFDAEDVCNQGKFHHARAWALRLLYGESGDEEFLDRALIEYEAARQAYEDVGHARHEASVLNNLGFLYKSSDPQHAHRDVDLAITIYQRLNDRAGAGSAKDTKALVFLAEGNLKSALRCADESIALLKTEDDHTWLAGSFITRGKILARMGDYDAALEDFAATEDPLAAMVESLTDYLSFSALTDLYRRYRGDTAALRIMQRGVEILHSRSLLKAAEFDEEGERMKHALEQSEGSVTKAAEVLGIAQSTMRYLIESKHSELKGLRKPPRKRRKPL